MSAVLGARNGDLAARAVCALTERHWCQKQVAGERSRGTKEGRMMLRA